MSESPTPSDYSDQLAKLRAHNYSGGQIMGTSAVFIGVDLVLAFITHHGLSGLFSSVVISLFMFVYHSRKSKLLCPKCEKPFFGETNVLLTRGLSV